MELITNIEVHRIPPLGVATIGFFDGVHRGHTSLINQVKQVAHERNVPSIIITFANHPRQVLKKEYIPFLLSTQQEKLQLLSATGIDYCVVLPFTLQMAALTAREFMEQVLKNRLGIGTLIIGYDHHFGKKSNEGFDEYQSYGKDLGIEVLQASAHIIGEVTVSSSVIRHHIERGEVEEADRLLGHPYTLQGKVVDGEKIGRTLGFPTANIACDSCKLLPADGVYAVDVHWAGESHKGMLNIGCRPTLHEAEPQHTIEVHILHWSGDLYGKNLDISFIKHIRGEQQFATLQELAHQLQSDAQTIDKL